MTDWLMKLLSRLKSYRALGISWNNRLNRWTTDDRLTSVNLNIWTLTMLPNQAKRQATFKRVLKSSHSRILGIVDKNCIWQSEKRPNWWKTNWINRLCRILLKLKTLPYHRRSIMRSTFKKDWRAWMRKLRTKIARPTSISSDFSQVPADSADSCLKNSPERLFYRT